MKDITTLLLPDIHEILVEGKGEGLREALADLHPADLADLVASLEDPEKVQVFDALSDPQRVATFEHLEEDDQEHLMGLLGRGKVVAILDAMSPDDRADFVKAMPERTAEALLPLLAQAERNDVRRLVSYPEGTAGSIMTTEYAALPGEVTVAEALERLRQVAPERETIYYVYVVRAADRQLQGVVTLTELVRAKPGLRLEEAMHANPITVVVDADQEAVARTFEHYDFLAMPVVDGEGRLLGIITHDDVLDVVEEESTEDAHRMGAVEPLDVPYLRAGFWSVAYKRGLWLSVLFLGEMFTGTAMRHYESTVGQLLGLVLFIPLIISSGGNSGSQSATLITRSLALGEVDFRDWIRVFRREAAMGVVLGGFLGAIGYCRALLWHTSFAMAAVVAIALVGVVLWGGLVGSLLPLFFKRIGLDPAVTSTPFVASLVDVFGIVIYFKIAQALLLS
jgi:magnesium transporter